MNLLRNPLCMAAMLLAAATTAAQDAPRRPIHLVVPYPAGGIADKVGRDVAELLQKRLRQTVIVENRPGAAGNIGIEWVMRQPADGHTLLLAPASNLTLQDALFRTLPYDPRKDLAPLSLLVQTPQVLLVHRDLPVSTPAELVAHAKAHPGRMNFGTSLGSYSHLAGEWLKARTGGDFTAIPYQGAAPALNDLLGGQTQFAFHEVTSSLGHITAGRVKALAVAHGSRLPQLPDVPTLAELGFAGFEVTSWYALVARSGTSPATLQRLAAEVRQVARSPEFGARYSAIGAFAVGSTPVELAAFIQKEAAHWSALARQSGVTPQ